MGHGGAGPGIGNDVGGGVPAVEVDGGPVGGVDEVNGPQGHLHIAAGAGAVFVVAVANQGVAVGAEAVQVMGGVGAAFSLVDNGDAAGAADGAGNLAVGHGESVAGNLIGVSAIGHGVGGDADINGAPLGIHQHHAGVTPLHIGDAAFVGHIFALAGKGVMELVHSRHLGIGPGGIGGGAQVLGDVGGTGQVQAHGI